MLLFKKKYLDAIRAGTKTQTIRLWKHRRMKAGQRSYIPGAGHISVLAVDEVAIEELTEQDAQRDGFESAESLRSELRQLYDGSERQYRAYRVRFELCSDG